MSFLIDKKDKIIKSIFSLIIEEFEYLCIIISNHFINLFEKLGRKKNKRI